MYVCMYNYYTCTCTLYVYLVDVSLMRLNEIRNSFHKLSLLCKVLNAVGTLIESLTQLTKLFRYLCTDTMYIVIYM